MFKCGLAGCWARAVDLGQVVCVRVCVCVCVCVRVCVPTFDQATTHEDCMKEVEEMCTERFNLPHVWMAMCDIHKSDKSGQSREDVVRNTAGHWILCKYAVTAHHECYQFYEMCRGAQTRNPLTGQLRQFQSYIANLYKMRKFDKPKSQIATTPLFYNGVRN